MPVILFATALALSALYAPQPLLPLLSAEFGISREAAAFLTTIAFIPLTLAPLVYGYLLESVSPRRMLRTAVLLLAISELLFFYAPSYPVLVALRLLQGLLIPAMLTSLMTFLSRTAREANVQRVMAIYVAATIVGGFLGRAISGAVATWFGWRASFLLLAVSLLACFVLLRRLSAEAPVQLTRPTPGQMLEVLVQPLFRRLYLVIFCLFLVFSAVMNFIPFRLTEISEQANALRIGLIYTGYLMGIVFSLLAVRLSRAMGGELKAIMAGLSVAVLALAGFLAGRPEILFVVMFLFCGAIFLVHATTSGLLNRLAAGRKGIVNGLYVSFYYGGGTVGSFAPGFLYRAWGWPAFLLLLLVVTGVALVLAAGCRQTEA